MKYMWAIVSDIDCDWTNKKSDALKVADDMVSQGAVLLYRKVQRGRNYWN